MFLTENDYKKILRYLTDHGIKDSAFDELSYPFDGNEYCTLIKDGKNYKTKIKNILISPENLTISSNGNWVVNGEDTGIQAIGPKGDPGRDGNNGKDGKSAYDIAVSEGFEGTEEEWINSLNGADGRPGENGKSAYEIAKEEGFQGTEEEWIKSLKGDKGEMGLPAVTIVVTGDNIVFTEEGQTREIHIELYAENKKVIYNNGSDNNGFTCSTLSSDKTILDGNGAWNFRIDNDYDFVYVIKLNNKVDISTSIPYTITYNGLKYNKSIYINTVYNGEKGDKGDKGDQGEIGPQGPQGPKGDQGGNLEGNIVVSDELGDDTSKVPTLRLLNSLAKSGYMFAGVATPITNPGTPTQRVYYLASEDGTYTYFNNIKVEGELAVFVYDTFWSKQSLGHIGYTYMGVATPSTKPSTPTYRTFYLASQDGTYTNFGSISLSGELAVLMYDTSWSKQSLGAVGGGGNMILDWNTDAATTRKQVSSSKRKAGMQISYLNPTDGWTNEQYIGTAVDDTNWAKDENWERIVSQSSINELSIVKLAMPLLSDSVIKVSNPYTGYTSEILSQDYMQGSASLKVKCSQGDKLLITGTALGTRNDGPLYCLVSDDDNKTKLVSSDNEVAENKEIEIPYNGTLVINVKSTETYSVYKIDSNSNAIQDHDTEINDLAGEVFSEIETLQLSKSTSNCYDLTPSVGQSISLDKVPSGQSYIISQIFQAFKGEIFEIQGKGLKGGLWALVTKDGNHTLIAKSAPEDMWQVNSIAKVYIEQDCLLLYNTVTVYAGVKYSVKRIKQSSQATDIDKLKNGSNELENEAKRCNLIKNWCKGNFTTTDETPIDETFWDDNANGEVVSSFVDISEDDDYFINVDFSNSDNFKRIAFYTRDKSEKSVYGYNTLNFSAYDTKVIDGWWKIPNMFPNVGVAPGKGQYSYFRICCWIAQLMSNEFKDIIILKKSDFQRIYAGELNKLEKIPISTRRTDTFVGSINTFIDKILAKNPYSRFVFFNMYIPIPYLNRGVKTRWEAMINVIDALAKYWRTDCLKPDKLNLIYDDYHNILNDYVSDNCHISLDMPSATFFVEINSDTGVTKNAGTITISGGDWAKEISYEIGTSVSDVLSKIASAYSTWNNEILDDRVILKPKENSSYPNFDERPNIQNSDEVIVTFKRRESSAQKVAAMYRDFLNRQFLTGCSDKIIFHIGTSVPAGSAGLADGSKINYPYYAAKALEMEYFAFPDTSVEYKGAGMYNLSKGGSCIRQYDFGKTMTEGEPIAPRTTSWLTPTSEGGALKNNIEVLEKNALGTKLEPDLWVIDLSFNDMGYSLEWLLYDI